MTILLTTIFIGCVFFFAIVIDPFVGVFAGAIIGLILDGIIFFITLALSETPEEKERKRADLEYANRHPHVDAESFYRFCYNSGAKSTDTDNDVSIIMSCAAERCPSKTKQQAIDYYMLGKSEVKRIKSEDQIALISNLPEQEKAYEKHITRFAHLGAHDKVNKMCWEKANELHQKLERLKANQGDSFQSADKLYNLTKQKEYDWATMGGIASGIAGCGAGISVAIDAQIKNAEIRQQNAQLQNTMYTVAAIAWEENRKRLYPIESEMNAWIKKAQGAYRLQTREVPEADLMRILSPKVAQKTQNKTGSIILKVKISAYSSQQLKIKNNPAVIDGTIKAIIWKDDQPVGEAILTLPLDNRGFEEVMLEGICRNETLKYKETYTITFEPYKLWLIESLSALS